MNILFKKGITAMMIICLASLLVACGGPTYCKKPGCPSESHNGHDYCYTHKCTNMNCENERSYSNHFCEECLERAQ